MKDTKLFFKVTLVVYRFILPACILFFLLIVSQSLTRPMFLGSLGVDFIARIWISIGFCYLYISLSDIDKYIFRMYKINTASPDEPSLLLNLSNIILGSMLGLISIPITWWIIQFFLPIYAGVSWLLALVNGILLALPIVIRRRGFLP